MLSGNRLENTRVHNRKMIIEAIRRHGPISRVEIVRMTGLTKGTISTITGELLRQEIIAETGRRKDGQRGQPAVELALNPGGRFAIGFELSRDHLSGVLIDLVGREQARVYESWSFPTPDAAMSRIAERTRELLETTAIARDRVLGVGVAMPGPFQGEGLGLVSPKHFPGWDKLPLQEHLGAMLDVDVFVEQDVIAAALGEYFYGSGQSYQNFFYIHIGVGVGGAMILNGHPYQSFSPNLGEIGLLPYAAKGPQALCNHFLSIDQLMQFLREHGISITDIAELEQLFRQRNPYFLQWLSEATECLKSILKSVNLLLGPQTIFLGGRFPVSIVDEVIKRLHLEEEALRAFTPSNLQLYQAPLRHAGFGDRAPALGAATYPFYYAFSAQSPAIREQNQ